MRARTSASQGPARRCHSRERWARDVLRAVDCDGSSMGPPGQARSAVRQAMDGACAVVLDERRRQVGRDREGDAALMVQGGQARATSPRGPALWPIGYAPGAMAKSVSTIRIECACNELLRIPQEQPDPRGLSSSPDLFVLPLSPRSGQATAARP